MAAISGVTLACPFVIAGQALKLQSEPLFVPVLGDSAVGSPTCFCSQFLAPYIRVFPTTANSLTYWMPGCPTLHCVSEPDYTGLVQNPEVRVCNQASLLLMPAMVTARMAHGTWANTTLTIISLLQKKNNEGYKC